MLNKNATSEVATILYGEQLTLWDSLDETAAESAQAEQAAPEPVQAVIATAKPLDDRHTLVVVVTLHTIEPLAGKWKPP